MCKVSVIIPAYNEEVHLRKTAESVLAGTFRDFELLLVDDGSTDGTLKVCRQLEEEDPRVQAFAKENGGVGSARNYGLDRARGEYIAFVDGDDRVSEDYLEILVSVAEENVLDWVVCGQTFKYEDDSDRTVTEMKLVLEDTFFLDETAAEIAGKRIFNGPLVTGIPTCCMSLYRRSIIEREGLRFEEEVYYGEDLLFNYRWHEHVRRFACLEKPMYQVLIHGNSQRGKMTGDPSSLDNVVILFDRIIRMTQEEGYPWTDEMAFYMAARSTRLILYDLSNAKEKALRIEGYEKLWTCMFREGTDELWNRDFTECFRSTIYRMIGMFVFHLLRGRRFQFLDLVNMAAHYRRERWLKTR